jgi:hypothetical protein
MSLIILVFSPGNNVTPTGNAFVFKTNPLSICSLVKILNHALVSPVIFNVLLFTSFLNKSRNFPEPQSLPFNSPPS